MHDREKSAAPALDRSESRKSLRQKRLCDPLERIARLRNFTRETESHNHILSPRIFCNEIDGLQKSAVTNLSHK